MTAPDPAAVGNYAADDALVDIRCVWCHMLDGRRPGRPVTAGCVHEHLSTLYLCHLHEHLARTKTTWCKPCRDAGHDEVPVSVITAPLAEPVGGAR